MLLELSLGTEVSDINQHCKSLIVREGRHTRAKGKLLLSITAPRRRVCGDDLLCLNQLLQSMIFKDMQILPPLGETKVLKDLPAYLLLWDPRCFGSPEKLCGEYGKKRSCESVRWERRSREK